LHRHDRPDLFVRGSQFALFGFSIRFLLAFAPPAILSGAMLRVGLVSSRKPPSLPSVRV
jgi:hypothetical protein